MFAFIMLPPSIIRTPPSQTLIFVLLVSVRVPVTVNEPPETIPILELNVWLPEYVSGELMVMPGVSYSKFPYWSIGPWFMSESSPSGSSIAHEGISSGLSPIPQ